ncbi:MAG: PRC-barrel domain-containing protein [Parvularcula sp.]|jgi:sporulation protein YlmC with PRC-barrel domain|nr:PRC-barrel domain-containing protein [Parvularcula sp.]
MEHEIRFDELEDLGDWKLVDDEQDIRGRALVDEHGMTIGEIDEMIVDLAEEKVVAIRLEDGRVCGVENLKIEDDRVIYHGLPVTTLVKIGYYR